MQRLFPVWLRKCDDNPGLQQKTNKVFFYVIIMKILIYLSVP